MVLASISWGFAPAINCVISYSLYDRNTLGPVDSIFSLSSSGGNLIVDTNDLSKAGTY